jgi:TonB family protein
MLQAAQIASVMKTGLPFLVAGSLVVSCVLAAETTPIRIDQTVEAQFPVALAFLPITSGEVRVVINVDSDGHLVDQMITGYTDRAFADEALQMLKLWQYQPATIDGKPVGSRMELQMHFASRGRVVSLSMSDAAAAFAGWYRRTPMQNLVCPGPDLDQPVEAVHTVNPPIPGGQGAVKASAGTALLDFYVDEHGRPRMPVVVRSTRDTCAQAAVWALSQWQFATPTRRGRPMAVRVRQEFVFPEVEPPAASRG